MNATNEQVGGLMVLSDTGDQAVCTDGHSSLDHTTRRTDVKWNSLGPQATLLMHPSGPTGPVLVLCGLIGLVKSHLVQADLFISSNHVTVSG